MVCVVVICHTHNAVLDTEAQLVPEIWPANEHHGNRGTPDDVHLDPRLRLKTLRDADAVNLSLYCPFFVSGERTEDKHLLKNNVKVKRVKLN